MNFVIVSPSMSGRFSLPYVIQSSAKQQSIRGFVPIAPVGTENYQKADYNRVTVSVVFDLKLCSCVVFNEDPHINCPW